MVSTRRWRWARRRHKKIRNLTYAILAVLLIAVAGSLRYGDSSVGFVVLGVFVGWFGAEAAPHYMQELEIGLSIDNTSTGRVSGKIYNLPTIKLIPRLRTLNRSPPL